MGIVETGKAYVHDFPYVNGRPILIVDASKHLSAVHDPAENEKLCVFLIEKALGASPEGSEEILGIFNLCWVQQKCSCCSAYALQPFSPLPCCLWHKLMRMKSNHRQDLKTPEMQYFFNIAPLPPGKPCNPSSHNQVVIFWFVMPLIICIFLWIMGHTLYRGWRLRKQRELVTTLSDSASVAFAISDGIPPPTSVPSGDNSGGIPPPISALPTDNSAVSPISVLPTGNSPVLPSAPPLEVLACHRCGYPECNILPSQFVCPSCGNMRPVNVYAG